MDVQGYETVFRGEEDPVIISENEGERKVSRASQEKPKEEKEVRRKIQR